ncbi:VOC family protein [Longimicrobium sp.]|uniref:VOC family protein n=1 Tax=Longimicrobium sp. TaxID=2029185 RepID=UPI002E343099|nr:VOC family protein [Longimicrobium sp.]HEX6036389.1 VOC family protein [Longimicrobium sp.]
MQIQMPRLFPDDRPVLGGSRIVSLVVQARDPAAARAFYAEALGLPLVADDGRSVRLDAGTLVLDLRRAAPGEPPRAGRTRVVLAAADPGALARDLAARGVRVGPDGAFTDPDGNRLALSAPAADAPGEGVGPHGVSVAEVVLDVGDAKAAASLFQGGLDLRPAGEQNGRVRYDAGALALTTVHADGAAADAQGGIAPVFHVEDLGDTVWQLARRGIPLARTVTYSRNGGVARLRAPSGHLLWLWEPSDEARDGPGGRRLEQLLARA